MGFDYSAHEWFCKYPELFENSEYVKNMLLYVRKAKHIMNDLTDFYEDNYVPDINPFSSPFFHDVREINNNLNKWEEKFHELYNNIDHKYEINEMDILQTGGYVYVCVGLLKDNYWFWHGDDDIYIFDAQPLDPKDEDRDDYEWDIQHRVAILQPNEKTKYIYEQMDNLVDNIITNPQLNSYFHDHFKDIIKEIDSSEYEK